MGSYVYLIRQANSSLFKIGISITPERRLHALQAGTPIKLELFKKTFVQNPNGIEKELHDKFKKQRIHREWFQLTDSDITSIDKRLNALVTEPQRKGCKKSKWSGKCTVTAGQPSGGKKQWNGMKYSPECIKKLEAFTAEMTSESTNFWQHSSIHHIACLLSVHRDTIYAWKKDHPEFSDTIKRWEEKRNAMFLELRQKSSAWIFLAKNWLEMTDEQSIKHSGELKTDNKLTIEVVSVSDNDEDTGK